MTAGQYMTGGTKKANRGSLGTFMTAAAERRGVKKYRRFKRLTAGRHLKSDIFHLPPIFLVVMPFS